MRHRGTRVQNGCILYAALPIAMHLMKDLRGAQGQLISARCQNCAAPLVRACSLRGIVTTFLGALLDRLLRLVSRSSQVSHGNFALKSPIPRRRTTSRRSFVRNRSAKRPLAAKGVSVALRLKLRFGRLCICSTVHLSLDHFPIYVHRRRRHVNRSRGLNHNRGCSQMCSIRGNTFMTSTLIEEGGGKKIP